MTKKEKKYFNLARSVALCSAHHKFHIGCVIVHQHRLISISNNQIKSHPQQKKLNRFRFSPCDSSKDLMHAELAAILKTPVADLHGAIMYIYREDKHNHIALSRPCPACMAKIKEVGIKTIYYTTPDGFCREDLRYK